ncbi:hypothetical protein A6B43_07345 [Vespertiliibacter pulmonis]|uniref:Lipoprotein n=1 Tax=Vespertiliibacter pulmonis TaxID=1443036 RepID=A0A3N4W892_9PAST|nr:hypothetical protein [Vespertiliibacter pulmonis]QLB21347.1 hypothetical protein A6B43_07345 [Vespertiliibacter pulmonis]RPE85757.1 hypothetical protein EDC46_0137 [Vespertiliibacter pulmonis]
MKYHHLLLSIIIVNLTACAITPQQKMEREAKRVKAEQALQVSLAKQCDPNTAELMNQQFNPPLSRSEKEQALFERQYVEKVNSPMFQACYKLAWQNYKAQEEIRQMRYDYNRDYGFGLSRFCNACWW